MNSTCAEAYSIFCEHNKGVNYEKVTFILNVLNIYIAKPLVDDAQLTFLSHYIHFTVGTIDLTPYEINILVCAISKLKISGSFTHKETLGFMLYSITRNVH